MADLKIKRIEIQNWMTIRDVSIEFPDHGVVMVMGQNLAANGKLCSVGSGKTALGEALSRTLLGVRGRYANLGHYLTDTEKRGLFCKVEADFLSKPLLVELGFKSGLNDTGEGFRFQYGDSKIQRSHIDDTRIELGKTLKVTPDLANWAVFIDGDKLSFDDLSHQKAVDLLMTALAQPPWTEYHGNAAKALQKSKIQLAASSESHTQNKKRLEEAEESLRFEENALESVRRTYERARQETASQLADLEKSKTEVLADIEKGKSRRKEIVVEIKEIEDRSAKAHHDQEIVHNALIDEQAILQRQRRAAAAKESEARVKQDIAWKAYKELKDAPKICPTCNQEWKHSDTELHKLNQIFESASVTVKAEVRATALLAEKEETLEAKLEESSKKLKTLNVRDAITALSEEDRKWERWLSKRTEEKSSLDLDIAELSRGPDDSKLKRQQTIVEQRKLGVTQAKQKIEESAASLTDSSELVKIVSYWHQAFGPGGIPNTVLTEAVAPLNSIAKRVSNLMTGANIEISYSTARQLVSGVTKPELNIKVVNKLGSKRLEGSSKGETGLINLIISETLSEIGQISKRIGYRWYDEALPNQDSIARRNIYSYFRETARRHRILIFVVDHNPEAANFADYVLTAEKTSRGTVFKW